MYRKHLAYLAMVSLKYFFNIDHYLVHQLLLTFVVAYSSSRRFINDSIALVAVAASNIKQAGESLRNSLQQPDTENPLVAWLQTFKHNTHKEHTHWRFLNMRHRN